MVKKCPKCRIALTQMEYQPGAVIFWCGLCSGVWVDGKELYDIVRISPDAIPVPVSSDARTCPECGNRVFYPVNFPGTEIVIDICEGCKGIWFDKGELQAIKTFVQSKAEEESGKPETASERMAAWVNNVITNLKSV